MSELACWIERIWLNPINRLRSSVANTTQLVPLTVSRVVLQKTAIAETESCRRYQHSSDSESSHRSDHRIPRQWFRELSYVWGTRSDGMTRASFFSWSRSWTLSEDTEYCPWVSNEHNGLVWLPANYLRSSAYGSSQDNWHRRDIRLRTKLTVGC